MCQTVHGSSNPCAALAGLNSIFSAHRGLRPGQRTSVQRPRFMPASLDTTKSKPRRILMVHGRPNMVCGGQSPMFTFRNDETLQRLQKAFREAENRRPVRVPQHSSTPDSDGSSLIAGNRITGFANVEEDEADRNVGKQIMPWRIQGAATARGAHDIQGLWKPFAVRDERLITGQQQHSGQKVAELLMKRLGV